MLSPLLCMQTWASQLHLCAGYMAGAELAPLLTVLRLENGNAKDKGTYLPLQDRLKVLQNWVETDTVSDS